MNNKNETQENRYGLTNIKTYKDLQEQIRLPDVAKKVMELQAKYVPTGTPSFATQSEINDIYEDEGFAPSRVNSLVFSIEEALALSEALKVSETSVLDTTNPQKEGQ